MKGWRLTSDERARIQRSLGDNIAMILQSHGLLSVGRTVADAFYIMYYLNRACEIQMATAQLAPLSPIHHIPAHLRPARLRTADGRGARASAGLAGVAAPP
ncbi:aldolase II superfamily protein [Raoultella terrigena]|uniref:Aldolase II superfamily protein n=1 Tax=Raoultella terrigena TaxID=577 RepID=A0A485C8C3_RAOTE|nr:aldolase II superfamily protein [Raoultella terrigena]